MSFWHAYKCIGGSTGGGGAPPLRVPILSFWHTKFSKRNRLGSPHPLLRGPCPPYGKSWIRHCSAISKHFDRREEQLTIENQTPTMQICFTSLKFLKLFFIQKESCSAIVLFIIPRLAWIICLTIFQWHLLPLCLSFDWLLGKWHCSLHPKQPGPVSLGNNISGTYAQFDLTTNKVLNVTSTTPKKRENAVIFQQVLRSLGPYTFHSGVIITSANSGDGRAYGIPPIWQPPGGRLFFNVCKYNSVCYNHVIALTFQRLQETTSISQ